MLGGLGGGIAKINTIDKTGAGEFCLLKSGKMFSRTLETNSRWLSVIEERPQRPLLDNT